MPGQSKTGQWNPTREQDKQTLAQLILLWLYGSVFYRAQSAREASLFASKQYWCESLSFVKRHRQLNKISAKKTESK